MGGEIEADAAFGVAWGVDDRAGDASYGDELAIFERVIWGWDGGGGDTEPASLNVHHFDQREVVLVIENGRAGELLEAMGSGDVVDVGVGDDDLFDREVVGGKDGHDAGNVVTGVDDDGLVGGFVSQDGAVALERADGENLVDHDDLSLD